MSRNPLVKQFVDFQRQLFEFQKSALDSSFDAIVALQDQQEELVQRLVDQAPVVPPEAREALQNWSDTYRRAREEFRASADKGFELLQQYLDRIALDEEGTDEGEANESDRS